MVAAGHHMAGLASVAWACCYAAILTAVPRVRPALAASPPPPPPPPVVCVGEDISLQELADEGCEIVQGSVLISGIGAGQTDGGTVSNALLAQVTGDFTISGSTNGGLVVLDFSTLESVGGALVSNDQSTSPLQVVSFDALTTVGDTLEFSFNSDLQNLGLIALANVGGPFTVNNNAALATLDLPQLSTVGGALSLTNGLGEVSASALESVGGNFQVQNTQIASLEFDALASVGLTVDVQDNADLVTFALPALTSAGSLSISDLASLSQLELGSLQTINSGASFLGADTVAQIELPQLQQIGGDLVVANNLALETFSASQLQTIGNDMTITGNPALAMLDMPQLEDVNNILTITSMGGSAGEVDLSALGSVENGITLENNPGLVSVDLGSLNNVAGDLLCSDNAALAQIDLAALTSVNGNLIFTQNANLPQLNIDELSSVQQSFNLESNAQLQAVSSGSLQNIGGSFVVTNCDALAALALPALASVSGSVGFVVSSNSALQDLSGGTSQLDIGGPLNVTENGELALLSLSCVTVGANVSVTSNAVLENATLAGLQSVGGVLDVLSNPRLLTLDVRSLASVGGSIRVEGNGADAADDSAATPGSCTVGASSGADVGGAVSVESNEAFAELRLGIGTTEGAVEVLRNTGVSDGVFVSGVQAVGGSFDVLDNAIALLEVSLPVGGSQTRTIDGNVSVQNNTLMERATFEAAPFAVGGYVAVSNNPAATLLSLSCVTVGANVSVTSNAVLENATLAGLQSVGGVLDVLSNPRLLTLDVRSLASVGGSIRVEGNGADAADDSAATPGSCTVGASSGADVGGAVSVESNEAFAELRLGIRTTADDFIVQDNDKLGDGTYVTGLRLVMGMLIVQRNVAMGLLEVSLPAVSMNGNEQPANITGNVTIFLNAAMVSASFGNNDNPSTLVIGGAVSVTDNVLLDTLLMATLTHVGAVGVLCERNALAVLRMDRLSRVVGPEGVLVRNNTIVPSQNNTAATAGDAVIGRSLETDFDVVVEESHRFRTAFLSVAFVAGSVRVQNNGDLSGGCAVVSVVNITGNLTIRDNNWLERVQALQTPLAVVLVRGVGVDRDDQAISDPIGEIGGHVNVSNNTVVASFSMAGIVAVGQEFAVIDNESLQNVTARSLSTVGAYVWVQFNPVLDTLLMGDLLDAGRDVNVTENGDGSSGRPLRAAGVVDFGQLDTVGLDVEGEGFDLVRSDSFETLDIAKIRLCGIGGGSDFRVVQNMQLAGTLYVEAFERSDTILVHQNPVLEHMLIQGANLSLPLVDSVRVTENAELLDIAVIGLENVAGEYYVNDNSLLEEALFQMGAHECPVDVTQC